MILPTDGAGELAAELELPLLGVPTRFRSNSPDLIAAVERALGAWRALPPADIDAGSPLLVDLVIQPLGPGDPARDPAEPLLFRAHDDRLLAGGGGSLLGADAAAGRAFAAITPELAADGPALRRQVIERLGLWLAAARDRAPVRAAGLARGGRAVLLCGPRGSGKSALCYAALRAGFALLADDLVHVSLADGPRLWGQPGPVCLPPGAARLFPELARLTPEPRGDGEHKIAVEPLPGGAALLHRGPVVVCLMERRPGQASRLERAPADAAAVALGERAAPAVEEVYWLRAGDPASAAALLATVVEG